jgi:site-specific DNA-methyltransferase (adenine-specific)
MIYVFSKSGAFYNRVDISGNFKGWEKKADKDRKINVYSNIPGGWKDNGNDGTTRCALSVIQNSTSSTKGGHPTEKPEALYRFLIERYCPADGTMLDPTAGSFNSVFTALAMGRDAIGIEKDKGFFLKAKKRALE